MRRLPLASLFASTSGVAAVEMALATPMLVALMFGSFELGNYFLSEHVVVKAVRDGARYAARQGFSGYVCPSTITDATNVKNVTRTGQVSGGSARLASWTDNSMIIVSLNCTAISGGNYQGIYKGMTDVPVVTVSAAVPYAPLFGLSFLPSLSLNAESVAPVVGL